jgi:phospholipid N-methyltransferase
MMMTRIDYLKESLKTIWTTGAVARSSKFLVREMMRPIDFRQAKVIVELGAGDGVFTKYLLRKMRPDAILLCFEINPEFCKILRGGISDPRFVLIEDSAEYLPHYLAKHDLEAADYIVSGIPFIALPNELGDRIIQNLPKCLTDSGLFIQYNYSLHKQKTYQKYFREVQVEFVPLNIPPAFVMICRK